MSYGKDLSFSSFGAQVSAVKRLAVAIILLHTLNGIKLPVSILIVPELAAHVGNSVRAHMTSDPHIYSHWGRFYSCFVQDRAVRSDRPTAVESRLDYLLSGPLPLPQSVNTSCVQISGLSCNIRLQYILESGTTTPHQNQNTEFLQIYLSTKVSTQPDGSYCPKFPWKDNHPPLPSNYNICAKRTRSMAYRLAKTPTLQRIYGTIIEDKERRK